MGGSRCQVVCDCSHPHESDQGWRRDGADFNDKAVASVDLLNTHSEVAHAYTKTSLHRLHRSREPSRSRCKHFNKLVPEPPYKVPNMINLRFAERVPTG